MLNLRKEWWKILLISLCGVIIWGISRVFIFRILIPINDPPDMIAFGESFLAEKGLFNLVLIVIGMTFFSLYSVSFIYLEERLFGNKFIKGLIYGSVFFIILIGGFFEFYYFFNGTMTDAVLSFIADGIPIFTIGIILGLVFSTDKEIKQLRPKKNLISIIFITIFFTIARTIFYNYIYPTPLIKQEQAFFILILYGITVGIAYYLLSQGIEITHPLKKALVFSLILAVAWVPLNFFVTLKYNFPSELILYLILLDLTGITLGALLNELINKNRQ